MPPDPQTALLDPEETMVGTANGPGLWVAPAGTVLPELGQPFADPWWSGGYLSDDGPTLSTSIETEEFTPWQSRVPIRTEVTSRGLTAQFVMWQLNERTIALFFDAEVPEVTGGLVDMEIRSDQPSHLYALAIDVQDAEQAFRIGFTRASLSDAGDVQFQRGSMVPLDVTLSALDDGGVLGRVKFGTVEAGGLIAQAQSHVIRTPAQSGSSGSRRAPEPES